MSALRHAAGHAGGDGAGTPMEFDDRIRFFVRRLSERLWVRPAFVCALSIAAVFGARAADRLGLGEQVVPDITLASVERLLSIMAASMLVIATFAVASMVSAYASVSRTATPRSFTLVVADDVSQNALSTFIGAFIFSIVGLTSIDNDVPGKTGRAALFVLTATVFALVILTFVRWVDNVARLGRLGTAIGKVEAATDESLRRRRKTPALSGVPVRSDASDDGRAVHATSVGYVQRIDVPTLQAWAEEVGGRVTVAALPGTLAAPGRPLAHVRFDDGRPDDFDDERITAAFVIGRERVFDEDPRFGLVVLAEIADKALSPGVNDPGTAIAILGSFVRLFTAWDAPTDDEQPPACDRVEVPELSIDDMFDDAFTPIARDGAGIVEVVVRLQKAFEALGAAGDGSMRDVARAHARSALARAEEGLRLPADVDRAREAAAFATRSDA